MGAGAVKGQPSNGEGQGHTSTVLNDPTPQIGMACENCAVEFTIFKRKKTCCECGRHHCSSCLPREPNRPSNQRRCSKCRLLLSGDFTRQDLQQFKIKDLRLFLVHRNEAVQNCTEKNDLVELALQYSNSSQHWREQEEHRRHIRELQERRLMEEGQEQQQTSPPSVERSEESVPETQQHAESPQDEEERLQRRREREMRETERRLFEELNNEETKETRKPKHRAGIEIIKKEQDIEDLTVKQLKEILATSFVDYKGCCEKWELVDRVKRLWQDTQKNHIQELAGTANDNDLCKICMDKMIDCVLLECGHMITCTKCGKRLAECPVCRQNVIRVVHTFKA